MSAVPRRFWKLLRLPLLVVVVISALSACGLVDRAFFFPLRDPGLLPPADLGTAEVVRFPSEDGTSLA